MRLDQKTCTPCRGGTPPMTPEQAHASAKDVPDWDLLDDGTKLRRTYRFKDFGQAFALVEKIAMSSEAEGHHPDVTFGWGYVTVLVYTHKIEGLHENDFIMAAKYDRAYAEMPKG